ncbi:NAD(P)/FAD-dependent oxidoreductase [Pirellulaceae bacterium SH449]
MTHSTLDIPPRTLAVVGCGLAGAAVAWQAFRRGWNAIVIDRADTESCSRVAAGLVTPITGGRGAGSWQWERFFPAAREFYRFVEQQTGTHFWNEQAALRVFQSPEERELFSQRWGGVVRTDSHSDNVMPSVEMLGSTCPSMDAPYGACTMQPTARLSTTPYLDATKSFLKTRAAFIERDLDCNRDIDAVGNSGRPAIAGVDHDLDAIVFCQGFASRENRWFADLPLHPARGDILRLAPPAWFPINQVVHHSAWLAPNDDGSLLLGATYDRKTLDGLVDDRPEVLQAKATLIERFRKLLPSSQQDVPIEAIEHRAAVRPASYDRHPLLGAHPDSPNVFCLNGLGSKGSLMSPNLASVLLDHISGQPLPAELDWTRY